jgi:hypothetical protein
MLYWGNRNFGLLCKYCGFFGVEKLRQIKILSKREIAFGKGKVSKLLFGK